MTRRIPDASPWRYTALVSGEVPDPPQGSDQSLRETAAVRPSDQSLRETTAVRTAEASFRRVRVLQASRATLGSFADAVRMEGASAVISPCEREDAAEPTAAHALMAAAPKMSRSVPLSDGVFAGLEGALRRAAARVAPSNRDLAATVEHALESFDRGRPAIWRCGQFTLQPGLQPLVMGVLNLTPDSFSDGGVLENADAAERAAWKMVEEGVDLLDIGGESTRPHALPVSAEVEISRVRTLLERLQNRMPVPISIDTSKAEVARMAIERGASVINDVTALEGDPEMLPLAAATGVGVVLMHKKGHPGTMQDDPRYTDLVREVFLYLHRRARVCIEAGIVRERLALDPGIGFGKTVDHNLCLLDRLREFTSDGLPVLAGPSRKGFLGKILDLPVTDRLEGTLAAVVAAVLNGASIVRVHDVAPAVRAVKVAAAIRGRSVG